MVSLVGQKAPLSGLLLAVAYSSMVLDIIFIVKVHENQNTQTYPPAVVAMLVNAILHVLFSLGYFVMSGKAPIYKAMNIAMALVFFILYGIGSTAAAIALKTNEHYCPSSASNLAQCRGVLRGTVGLGFSLVGLDLIFLGYLAVIVSKHGAWSKDMYNTPERKIANADLDKPPAH